MVSTDYIDQQAYKEVIKDGHPILSVTGRNIAAVLIRKNIRPKYDVEKWLASSDRNKSVLCGS